MAFPVPTHRDSYIVISTCFYLQDCGSVQGTCEDDSSIMYAWARNAPPTKLPKNVGFKVGRNSGTSYFVLQIHYGDVSAFRDVESKRKKGMFTNADVACEYDSYPLYPFAFRTHTHSLGKVVSGYRVRDGKWSLIGRQSPQLPQAFYPANKEVTVRYGDTIAARCVFTGEGRTSKTYIGGTSSDEMCNFYMMYYMDSKHANPFMNCMETGSKELFEHIPAEANVPIAVSPGHMHAMMGMGNNAGMEIYLIYVPYCLILGLNYEFNSFNSQARYQQRFLGPIQQSAILVVDPANGRILKASGRNMFYLPHGITTDKDNNYWVTDVALHQVSCCLRLRSFAFSQTYGLFFSFFGQSSSSDRRRRTPFQIPHSLVFLPDRKEVCVADRENGRIQCFIAETGEFVKEIKNEEFGGEVFAIAYNGLIFAVNGDSSHHFTPLRGFVLGYSTKQILDSFSPTQKEFKMPHDIVVTKDGTVFVGDAGNKSVFKFSAESKFIFIIATLKHSVKVLLLFNVSRQGIRIIVYNRFLLLLDELTPFFSASSLSGKAVGTLNLGKFFASHKGYSRQGFDQLSTEGSDQERNVEDSSDSDTEEYSAPPPRPPPPQSSS
uniref:Peptidylglycine alpha-amidating monooxygenase n=1 Tax=Cyprinodon variegatus TaxID=28743 RepID=A0A3Q2CAI1_CYPVA